MPNRQIGYSCTATALLTIASATATKSLAIVTSALTGCCSGSGEFVHLAAPLGSPLGSPDLKEQPLKRSGPPSVESCNPSVTPTHTHTQEGPQAFGCSLACPSCTFLNIGDRAACEMCGGELTVIAPAPHQHQQQQHQPPPPQPPPPSHVPPSRPAAVVSTPGVSKTCGGVNADWSAIGNKGYNVGGHTAGRQGGLSGWLSGCKHESSIVMEPSDSAPGEVDAHPGVKEATSGRKRACGRK